MQQQGTRPNRNCLSADIHLSLALVSQEFLSYISSAHFRMKTISGVFIRTQYGEYWNLVVCIDFQIA